MAVQLRNSLKGRKREREKGGGGVNWKRTTCRQRAMNRRDGVRGERETGQQFRRTQDESG